MPQASDDAKAGHIGVGWLSSLFGLIISTFSIATLVHYGVATGDLSRPIEALISAYHDAVSIIFAPVEQLLAPTLRWLGHALGWDIHLYPHWRHILLLSLVFWLSWGRAYWNVSPRKVAAVVLVGIVFSLLGTLGAGALPLGGVNDVLIFALPAAASFLAFELMVNITRVVPKVRFLNLVILVLLCGLVGLIYLAGPAIARAVSGPDWTVRSPSLFLLGIAAILLGMGGLGLGAVLALFHRLPGEGWIAAMLRNPDFRVGLIMLGGFAGTAILFAVDAALKLSGP